MGLISFTSVQDGTSPQSSQVNNPLTTIYNEFNGNISAANLASNAVTTAKLADASVTNAKLATGAGEPGGAWTTWTPTWTNLTVGNGTVSGSYTQIGKTVHARYSITLGSTSSVGSSPNFTLPVTAATYYTTGGGHPIGNIYFDDASANTDTYGAITIASTTTARPNVLVNDVTFLRRSGLTATIPFTWVNTDSLAFSITYEAA